MVFRQLGLAGGLCIVLVSAAASAASPANLKPEIVAPSVVSTSMHEFSPAISPDGETLFFAVTNGTFERMTLLQSRRVEGKWATPEVLAFSGTWNDGDVALSPNGKRLFFISNRPKSGSGDARKDLDLWYVDRIADERWGEPVRLPDTINSDVNEVYPSVASDGTLYFGRDRKIYRARFASGRYQPPEPIGLDGFSFAIAPDQSIAVVGQPSGSATDVDMYLVEQSAGSWSAPLPLPDAINSSANDLAGAFSADGNTFYFVSQRKSPPVEWPRPKRKGAYVEVRNELDTPGTGLRDIYTVPAVALRGMP